MKTPRSSIDQIIWPGIPSHAEAVLMALQYQLEQSQWWSAETLRSLQFRQIEILLSHAFETVPYYREQLQAASIAPTPLASR